MHGTVGSMRVLSGCWFQAIAALAVVAATASCSEREAPRQYELRGQILAIRPESAEVLIKHGDIQGFMPGMTVPFKVREPALLAGKAPGDLVTAQLVVAPDSAWLSKLDKTGSAPLEGTAAIPPAAFATPLATGDTAPDATLTDQHGTTISMTQFRGHALVVTFIYTRCPLPQFCPMMDRRFAEVQQAIQADPRLAGRAHLLSVSFDPDHDRPETLKAHAGKLGADPAIWTFATAPREVVDRFAAAFGVNVIREADRSITHNLRTAVFAPDGRATTIYNGGDWTAPQVADELRRVLPAQ